MNARRVCGSSQPDFMMWMETLKSDGVVEKEWSKEGAPKACRCVRSEVCVGNFKRNLPALEEGFHKSVVLVIICC